MPGDPITEDPLGLVLTTLRDNAGVSALVGAKVSTVLEEPPSIRIRAGTMTRTPFGPGSGRVGMQGATFLLFCYGRPDIDTGEMEAAQLARVASSALHGRGPTYGGGRLLLRTWTPDIGEILRDPDLDWPYHTVRVETYAAAQAVTL